MKIKKGDQVLIIKGKDRGKKGKVLRGFPKEDQVLIEGVNIKKRHRKPKKEGEKGQVVEVPKPMPVSKLKLICSKCGKPTRVGYGKKSTDKTQKGPYRVSSRAAKIRVCKKCGGEI